jgi:hypothetical protein
MKLRLQIATTLLLIIPVLGFTQQIPNGDLEIWTEVPGALSGAEFPVDWETPDILGAVFGVSDAVVAKSTDSYDGSLAAELTTKAIEIPFVGTLTIPGTLALGTIIFDPVTLSAGVVGGYPMTEAPTSLSGYYKYSPAEGDTMNVTIVAKLAGSPIGQGEFRTDVATSSYTMFDAPITYFTTDIPDSILIIITSSGGFTSATVGSVAYIDGLALTGISANDELAAIGLKTNIFPNPAIEVINIDNPLQHTAYIEIFNLNGIKVSEQAINPGLNSLSISQLSSGIYNFRVTDAGNYVYTNKFVVAK